MFICYDEGEEYTMKYMIVKGGVKTRGKKAQEYMFSFLCLHGVLLLLLFHVRVLVGGLLIGAAQRGDHDAVPHAHLGRKVCKKRERLNLVY